MESTKTPPVIIANAVNEIISEFSFDDKDCEEWQDLEQFWGEEKQRLQDGDCHVNKLSSSLEEHLLNDDCLNEPHLEYDSTQEEFETKTIRGNETRDIPTSYTIKGFRPEELIVYGTYIDKNIIPGFQYRVRKNLTNEYLFEGKAKYLESIGMGYGKRLTFQGDSLNENSNYFWSDSAVNGYGFTFQAIGHEHTLNVFDTKTGQVIGRVLINNPSLENDAVLSTAVGERGYIEKEVKVQFSCDVILYDSTNNQNLFVEDVSVLGKAVVVRESLTSKAKVNQIFLDDFVVDSCLLLPEE